MKIYYLANALQEHCLYIKAEVIFLFHSVVFFIGYLHIIWKLNWLQIFNVHVYLKVRFNSWQTTSF